MPKTYLDTYDPTFDRSSGLHIRHLLGVIVACVPLLEKKILPVVLEEDKLYAVQDPTPLLPSPLYYSTDFIRNYPGGAFTSEKCHVEMDVSHSVTHHLSQLQGPHSEAHFACKYPRHIFIASIVTDNHGYATLYVIDSNNNNLEHEKFKPFICKILEYTERHNAQVAIHRSKKNKKKSIQNRKKG